MRSKGFAYERHAERYLTKQGYAFRDRNYFTRCGEVDLIMTYNTSLVFIEVRYRKNNRFGSAEESITKAKQHRIITSAKEYINRHKLWHMHIQFDVVTLTPCNKEDSVQLNWIKNAFTAS